MQHLIKNNELQSTDPWTVVDDDALIELPDHALLPVSTWKTLNSEVKDRSNTLGIVIQDEDLSEILPDLNRFDVVAFKFSKFADGRAFTYARQLRVASNYQGEIRAMGDFMPDQVNYLTRCGFNAFAMRTAEEVDVALATKDAFSHAYQPDALEPRPLFRRRS